MVSYNRSFSDSVSVSSFEAAEDKTDFLVSCFVEHLAYLAESGVKLLPDMFKHYQSEDIKAFRKILEQPKEKQLQDEWIQSSHSSFMNEVSFQFMCFTSSYEKGKISAEKCIEKIIDEVLHDSVTCKFGFCFVSGKNPSVIFENQEFYPFEYSHDLKNLKVVKIKDVDYFSAPKLQKLTIPAPSGELLIADFFRFPFLQKISDEIDNKHEMNSTFGREQIMVDYANELGIIYGTGSSPHIVNKKGELHFGYIDYDQKESKDTVPYQSETSLRWYSIVDKQHLCDLLSKYEGLSFQDAKSEVESYIENNKNYITQLKLSKEHKYLNFYCSGDRNLFNTSFEKDFSVPNFKRDKTYKEIWSVLSPHDYPLKDDLTPNRLPKLS